MILSLRFHNPREIAQRNTHFPYANLTRAGGQYYPPGTFANLQIFVSSFTKSVMAIPFALIYLTREHRSADRCFRFFRGHGKRDALLCSASREKKGACVNSRHTRSQIEDNHQRATGRVGVPCPRTTSAIRIEQEGLFCSVLPAPPALRAVHKKNGEH